MDDRVDTSLLGDMTSLATSTLERATLIKESLPRSTVRSSSSDRTKPSTKKGALPRSERIFFWGLVIMLLILACGNLLLTFFVMGVLRLGSGMESIEIIPKHKITKFHGLADLGSIYKNDGIIHSYSDMPFSIRSEDSKVLLGLRTTNNPSLLEVGTEMLEVGSVNLMQVFNPVNGQQVFSTQYPNFGLPRGVKNLNVHKSQTNRIVSPLSTDLRIESDSEIRLKGNEGISFESNKISWAADQNISVRSVNGSVILDTDSGVFVEVNTLPLVGPLHVTKGRGQYKLCLCMPQSQLFRVPVPADNDQRKFDEQISCASFSNPCLNI